MVVGKPYIHFTINNEPLEAEVDYTYTWATTVETTKGPVNQPTLISSAAQAQAIFGVDMRPYFAQGAESLIMVRVVPTNTINTPQKGMFSFITEKDIVVYRAQQSIIQTKTAYEFTSYEDAAGSVEWAYGTVEQDGEESNGYIPVKVLTNSVEGFVGNTFYIQKDIVANGKAIYPLFTDANGTEAGIYVSVVDSREYIHKLFYIVENDKVVVLIQERNENGSIIPESYITEWNPDGTRSAASVKYPNAESVNVVKPYYTPVQYLIPKGTSLFNITTKYDGDYGVTVSVKKSSVVNEIEGSYDIVLTDPSLGSIKMNHVYDVNKIVNRINDAGLNFVAKATNAGLAISQAIDSSSTYVDTYALSEFAAGSGNITEDELIKNNVTDGMFLTTCVDSENNVQYLTKSESELVESDKENGTQNAHVKVLDYQINLKEGLNQSLVGSSNGEWDETEGRIPKDFRGDAHAAGLKLLRRMRIAGIFCMYEDNSIQLQYVYHGIDPNEPEKGMNNNETCKWRTIILGASHKDRGSRADLAARATALNDQYTLLLGQGLIDSGFYGIASTLTTAEKREYGIFNEHQLLPCECTQYIAGLRSKLNYDESIFGGQGRKRIRSVGDLDIAPLFDYEEEYDWDPRTYEYLNEAGVLTFTEEYGNITLTDGVTTCQKGFEEDEEGVMNILKYAQNAVYNVCLPYIGRNINGDLENAITMDIQSVLEEMKSGHGSIVDTDEYPAYTINVSLGSRANQLLGRIYIYLTITPAHALRQIEVEMTVQ